MRMIIESKTLSRDMEVVKDALMTERSVANYCEYLETTEDEIKNCNVIVEIGSGTEQEFSKYVKEISPHTKVIAIDPKLALPLEIDLAGMFPEEYDSRIRGRTNPEPNTIAALAQNLPLKSSSVDMIVASRSVPLYISDQETMNKVLQEIDRVLKENGIARIYPVSEGLKMDLLNKSLGNTTLHISKNTIKEEMGSKYNHFLLLTKSTSTEK